MAWRDITAKGQRYDKEKLTKGNVYTLNDYLPRLDLGLKTFVINGIDCGWCRYNKTFRPIMKAPKGDANEIGWDWNPEISMTELSTRGIGKKWNLRELVDTYHRLRDTQNNPATCNETTGLIDLIKWMDYKYKTPEVVRVYLSKQNDEIIKIYNRKIGKPATKSMGQYGWFGKDFPNEFLSVKENKKTGYKYKLLKGLYLHPHYRLPTKHRTTKPHITEDEAQSIFDFLTGK